MDTEDIRTGDRPSVRMNPPRMAAWARCDNLDDYHQFASSFLQMIPAYAADERVNIGVLAVNTVSLDYRYRLNWDMGKVAAIAPDMPLDRYRGLISAIDDAAREVPRHLGWGDDALEWLQNAIIPKGSISFTWSKRTTGIADDLDALVDDMFERYVAVTGKLGGGNG